MSPAFDEALNLAKKTRTSIYFFGRESVFGYPYAFVNWVHPQLGTHHWLQIRRGPETPFAEQLQIDGFRVRRDASSAASDRTNRSVWLAIRGGFSSCSPTRNRISTTSRNANSPRWTSRNSNPICDRVVNMRRTGRQPVPQGGLGRDRAVEPVRSEKQGPRGGWRPVVLPRAGAVRRGGGESNRPCDAHVSGVVRRSTAPGIGEGLACPETSRRCGRTTT